MSAGEDDDPQPGERAPLPPVVYERMALVLRAGLLLALALLVSATIAYLAEHPSATWQPSEPNSYSQYLNVGDLGTGLLHGHPTAYLTLGVLCLLATPVLRVLTGLYYFARRGERTLMGITLAVFLLLMIALLVVGPWAR